ncbi:hypothetical protein [Massilia sp. BJB1822]|uniref:hypothetical protein n=1 Tax=Massilia sp. BJB1822 TaxID=2744470 RepID=UPI0015938BE6|nr:hypothetical protein [Massilia sp. BJB1822]NVD97939.1 hypothetical protein [Massilia sp. BJB1822]
MESPFCCPACGTPYGEKFDPRAWKCSQLHEQAEKSLLPLVRFLLKVKRAKFNWVHWQEWFGPWLGEAEEREKRIATSAALRRIVATSDLDEELFVQPARQISVSSGRGSVTLDPQALSTPTDLRPQRQIYKSIRRHMLKQLPGHVLRRQVLFPERDEVDIRNGILWLSLEKCPYLQTIWLWRLRFEQAESIVIAHPSCNRDLSLLEVARNWPWRGAGDDSVWAHFVLRGFHAAAEIVCDWWERAMALATAAERDGARTMELYVEFAKLLSPLNSPVPPSVAAVFEKQPLGKGEDWLHVVGPTNGLQKLLACCRCGSSSAGLAGNPVILPP